MNARKKKWEQMNADELAAATAKYDEPFAADKYFKPMPARKRAAHLKSLRRGRPKTGAGFRRVMISLEQGLLKRADGYAKQHGLNRSQMIAKGLRDLISSAA